ncbi:MAG: FAD-binding protein [Myxococcota bacterium]|jgi:choline dehydrogenase-like flavoprotein
MGSLPVVSKAVGPRARRWDVIVLGSGIAGLVAAARLGSAGKRVLVVEESAARDSFPGLREPFFLPGLRSEGALSEVLRELGVPLIERRRLEPCDRAFQVIAPNLRADVGTIEETVAEFELWGIASAISSRPLLRALERAAEAERKAMLESPLVYVGRRGRLRRTKVEAYGRGLPHEIADIDPRLERVFEAQIRSLSNLATALPSKEAQARLLGSVLGGGSTLRQGPPWLHGLLRRRVEAHFGEFRSPDGPFELVSAGGQPGVSVNSGREIWLGRALVIAASASALAGALDQDPIPSFLATPRTTRRRISLHWKLPARAIPAGMGERLVVLAPSDPVADFESERGGPLAEAPLLCVSLFGSGPSRDLVASAVHDGEGSIEALEASIESRIRGLFPFGNGSFERCTAPRPRWDDDAWLEDPPRKLGWPTQIPLRVSSRPPVYRLDRAEVGGLGLEGDLLLGWRAGDAIASELA